VCRRARLCRCGVRAAVRSLRKALLLSSSGSAQLRRISIPRTPVNKGEMRKCLTLVNCTQEQSKDRKERPEPKNASSSGLSSVLFNAAAALLLQIERREEPLY
jgi:hypothetical protein